MTDTPNLRPSRTWRALALLALVVVAVAARALVDRGGLLDWVAGFVASPLFLPVLFVLYAVRPFLAIPLSLFSVVIGYRYGLFPGVALVLLGTVWTCLVPYAVSRYVRAEGGLLGRLTASSERAFEVTGDLRGMVSARLSPAPADLVSYGAGFSDVPLWAFVLGTLVGEAPWATLYVLVGRSMERVGADGAAIDVRVVAAFALLAAALVAGPVARAARPYVRRVR